MLPITDATSDKLIFSSAVRTFAFRLRFPPLSPQTYALSLRTAPAMEFRLRGFRKSWAPSVFIHQDNLYQHACFGHRNVYVLSTYSMQGRKVCSQNCWTFLSRHNQIAGSPPRRGYSLQLQTTPVFAWRTEPDVVAKLGPAN